MSEVSNVVLLSVDALRTDHLSSHGVRTGDKPRDRRACGTRDTFMKAFSASSHIREAVPSLLTGRRPTVFNESGYRLVTNHEDERR